MRELQVVFRTHLNFVVLIDIENRLMDAKWEGRGCNGLGVWELQMETITQIG